MTTPLASSDTPRRPRPWPLRALAVLGAWLALQVVFLALAFGWVAVYSHVVDPGHDEAYYASYAQRAVPFVVIPFSAPAFLAFAWFCARRAGAGGAAFARNTALLFVVMDAIVTAAVAGTSGRAWAIWVVASAVKVGAALAGGRLAARAAGARA